MNYQFDYYSKQLRELADEFYHQQISREEYLEQRKYILDSIDEELMAEKTLAEVEHDQDV